MSVFLCPDFMTLKWNFINYFITYFKEKTKMKIYFLMNYKINFLFVSYLK